MVLSGCCCPSGGLMARLCNRWPDGTVPDTPGVRGRAPRADGPRQARPAGITARAITTIRGFIRCRRNRCLARGRSRWRLAQTRRERPTAVRRGTEGCALAVCAFFAEEWPELMPLPPTPPNPPTTKRGDASPERLAVAPADGSSSIFARVFPSAVGLTEPKVEVKTELSAKDQQTLR